MAESAGPTSDVQIDPEATSRLADIYGQNGPQPPTLSPPPSPLPSYGAGAISPAPAPQSGVPDFLSNAVGALQQFGQGAGQAAFTLTDPVARTAAIEAARQGQVAPVGPWDVAAALNEAATPILQPMQRPGDVMPETPPIFPGAPLAAAGELAAQSAIPALRQAVAGAPAFHAVEAGEGKVGLGIDAFQKQIDALRAGGATDQEIADLQQTMNVAPEAKRVGMVDTAEGGQAKAAELTRALQTAAGQEGVPLSQHPLLADYGVGGPKGPVVKASHGGDIGTATRAVMSGDEDAINLFGDELSNQLIQNKVADILRRSGLPEDVVRRGLFAEIAEGRGAAIDTLSPAQITASADRFPPVPPSVVDQNVATVSQAIQQPQPMGTLITSMRTAGASDAEIIQGLRSMGLSAKEAAAWMVAPEAKVTEAVGGGRPPVPPGPPSVPGDQDRNFARVIGSGALSLFTDIPRAISLVGHLPLARQAAPLLADSILRGDPAEVAQALGRTVMGVMSEGSFQGFRRGAIQNLTNAAGKGGWERLILDTHGALSQSEEFALRSVIGRLPGIAQINRAYPAMLNSLRYGAAQAIVDSERLAGRDVDVDRIIDAVNLMSGRGRGAPFAPGGKAAEVMNGIFFGPKYLQAEVQTVPSVIRSLGGVVSDMAMRRPLDPVEVFKVRAFTGWAATGVGILKAMSMFGWNIDLDPHSRDFGMGAAPDGSRVDPWGGLGTIARLAIREATFAADAAQGRKPKFGAQTGADMLTSFFRGKLNPGLATAGANVLFGALPTGEALPDVRTEGVQGAYKMAFGNQPIQPLAVEAATGGPPTSPTIGGVRPQAETRFSLAKFLMAESGMTVKNTPQHINYDGLGAAPGEEGYGTGEILATFDKLRAASSSKWHEADDTMPAPSTTIGQGKSAVKLDQFSAQRWVKALGQQREIDLRQMLADPQWEGMSQAEQQKRWDETVRQADKTAGSRFLAHDLIQQTDPKLVVAEAVDGFIKQGASYHDKAYWVAALDRAGKLTPDVRSAIDALKDTPPSGKEPIRVDEYLRAAPIVHQYLSHAPYGTDAHPVGTPQDWAAVEQARQYEGVRRDALVRGGVMPTLAQSQARIEVSQQLAGVQRQLFLSGPLLVNPARRLMTRQYGTMLSRFLGTGNQYEQEPDTSYSQFPP